jgi:hypothetical protein
MTVTEEVAKVDLEAERQERFRRVVTLRANRILKDMELLLRTSNRNGGYSYTSAQADEVISKLQTALDALASAYAGGAGEKLRVEL